MNLVCLLVQFQRKFQKNPPILQNNLVSIASEEQRWESPRCYLQLVIYNIWRLKILTLGAQLQILLIDLSQFWNFWSVVWIFTFFFHSCVNIMYKTDMQKLSLIKTIGRLLILYFECALFDWVSCSGKGKPNFIKRFWVLLSQSFKMLAWVNNHLFNYKWYFKLCDFVFLVGGVKTISFLCWVHIQNKT